MPALRDRDLVLVEGAGDVLVRFDDAGATLADAAALLEAPVVLASPAVLAALNHAALACEALAARGSGARGWRSAGGVGARVAGPKHCGQRLATPLSQVGEQRMRA